VQGLRPARWGERGLGHRRRWEGWLATSRVVGNALSLIKLLSLSRSLSHQTSVKPWKGPLPKPRTSPPKTLGDAVVKKLFIRLRGGRSVPVSFKMALPLTNKTPITSPNNSSFHDRSENSNQWPTLPKIHVSTSKLLPTTNQSPESKRSETDEVQNSNGPNMGLKDKPWQPEPSPIPNRVLVGTGDSKAWFYPSKGLNEFFSWAGKPAWSNTKTPTATNPNPKPYSTPSSLTQQRRQTYADIVKMDVGGNGNGRGQENSRGAAGDRGHGPHGPTNNGTMAMGGPIKMRS
jgi:hypothetical protein